MNSPHSMSPSAASLSTIERYRTIRSFTEHICSRLEPEDCVLQSMPGASPIRWHAAHTTWFFETFLLKQFAPDYKPVNAQFEYLFNSYYNTVGEQFRRDRRGLLSRPTMNEVLRYRSRVDEQMAELLAKEESDKITEILEIGLQHEQQHQELMLTDIKHAFFQNPLLPAFDASIEFSTSATEKLNWKPHTGGVIEIGVNSSSDFSFDNETPRHETLLRDFHSANRLTTNGEYLEFVNDGGYQRPEFWLSEGWATVVKEGWKHPLYWFTNADAWVEFTLAGPTPLDVNRPLCHVSYFEADAFARWSNARLLTEAEWEFAATDEPLAGNFVESGRLHTAVAQQGQSQMFGDVWEWTQSPYIAYPGYRPLPGALGEYNGKFMCNQFVLRGGSCATSQTHIRRSYRNFFPPAARWQFTGIRLAQDAN